jgi:cobalt-zinc-cadmium efflux system outer membrane protein
VSKRGVSSLLVAGLLAGCATSKLPEPALSPEKSATAFAARSLNAPGLHRFLVENLGHEVGDQWDFEALSWAAFYFHPSLELARAQWASAGAAERIAGQRPNPTLTLTPGYNFTREAGISPWMPAINLDFLFSTPSKREQQAAAARHDAEAARLAVFSAAWQVRSDLRRALADTVVAARRESQFRAQADAQRSLLSLLEQRFEAGGIAATEVSVARTAWLHAESAAADAHGQALSARARAAAAIGVPVTALERVALPMPVPPVTYSREALAAAREEALRSRPDILMALAKYHAAHATLELEVAKRVPDFHLGPGYQWDQGSNKWTLALGLELPLFHRNDAAIAVAAAHRAEAAAQFNLVQTQAIAAIDQAIAAGEAARFQSERAHQLLEESHRQVARVQQRVELGAADQVEWQTAKLDQLAAENTVLDSESAAALAAGQLEDALQRPLPRIEAVAQPIPSSHE